MKAPIIISKHSETPKYVQISETIIDHINHGQLEKGQKLPSINEICAKNQLSRETVVKAFSTLREKGLITSTHGKGFYVSSTNTKTQNRIFVLFDTFTSYKETLYFALKDAFPRNTEIDIYFHHFNFTIFKELIASHAGKYTAYIIISINHKHIDAAFHPLPKEKLYLIDVMPKYLSGEYSGVFQDFELDVLETLQSIQYLIKKYESLTLVFRNTITEVPETLKKGFLAYCKKRGIKHHVVYKKVGLDIKKGEAYIVIDDEDLVRIVEVASKKKLKIGKDVGIISYNDTPLKKIVRDGISVISTDFAAIGSGIAKMILECKHHKSRNKTTFIDRGSF